MTGHSRAYTRCKCSTLEFDVPFARNRSRDIRSICQTDIYLPGRSKWTGRIAAPTTRMDQQNRLNHASRATQNANRVYHYDLAGYRLTDYAPSIRMFYCLVFTLNAYTNQLSRAINPYELTLVLKETKTNHFKIVSPT